MELRSVSYDCIEHLYLLALLIDQKLGLADDVDQQDVANLKLQFRLRVSGHIALARQRRFAISVWDQLPLAPALQNADHPGADRASDQL